MLARSQFAVSRQAAPPPTDGEETLRQAGAAGGLSCTQARKLHRYAGSPTVRSEKPRVFLNLLTSKVEKPDHRVLSHKAARGARAPLKLTWRQVCKTCERHKVEGQQLHCAGESLLMHLTGFKRSLLFHFSNNWSGKKEVM